MIAKSHLLIRLNEQMKKMHIKWAFPEGIDNIL